MGENFRCSGTWFLTTVAALVLAGGCSERKKVAPAADTLSPAAITLAHEGVTTTSVVLTWTAPGDDGNEGTAHQYDLRYSPATLSDQNWADAIQVSGEPAPSAFGTSESMTVSGLSPATFYTFALRTSDEVPNWSALSNVVPVTTAAPPDTIPPAAVDDLATGAVSLSSIGLAWTAPGDDDQSGTAAQYEIRFARFVITPENLMQAALVPGVPPPQIAGTVQTMVVTGLDAGSRYYFVLRTSDEVANWSGLSNLAEGATASPFDFTAPAAIEDLAVGAVTETSVALTWTAPGDDGAAGTAAEYDLRYATAEFTDGNFSQATRVVGAPAPLVAGTRQEVTVTGLAPGTRYFFCIRTADEVSNWSALSDQPDVTTALPPDTIPPAPVADLAVLLGNENLIRLTLTSPGDDQQEGTAAAYDLRYSLAPITLENFASATAVAGEPSPLPAGTTQTIDVTGLIPSTLYYFALKAADEVPNWSDLSNVVSGSTLPPPDLTPPADIVDLAGTLADPHTVELTWTAPGDDGASGTAASYDIRYSDVPLNGTNWPAATVVTGVPAPGPAGTSEHLYVGTLASDTDHYFGIKTLDEMTNASGLSNIVLVRTPPPSPPPPALPRPEFPDSVCITSADVYALQAKDLVANTTGAARALSIFAGTFMDQLNYTGWQQNGDCWNVTKTVDECTTSYELCVEGQNQVLNVTADGSCYGELYNHSRVFSASVFLDTRQAYYAIYGHDSETINFAWVSLWASDGNSGSHQIYQGDPHTSPVVGSVEWSRPEDGSEFELSYVVYHESMWTAHYEKDPCSGSLFTYTWDGSSYRPVNDIAWHADGSGWWDVYTLEGARIQHHTW